MNFRPADRISNPKLFALARSRWPGVPVTSAMLADVAALTGEPMYAAATAENVNAGLAEIEKDRRAAAHKSEIARSYERMGFNPETNYRKEG